MARYERETRVRAPFEEVWEFYSHVDGLEALTPGFLDLEVERVVGPDGTRDRDQELVVGVRAESSVQPFGVGPRQRWTSVIVDREKHDGAAYFVDEMVEGPFPEWRHTHSFYADGAFTTVRDHVRYRLPGGPVGDAAGTLGRVGLDPMFRYRHRRTRELLEAD